MDGLELLGIGFYAGLAAIVTMVVKLFFRGRAAVSVLRVAGLFALVSLSSCAVFFCKEVFVSKLSNDMHVLDAPQEVGGIAFPAGSIVWTEKASPGRVVGGRLRAETAIGGLSLTEDFDMSPDGQVRAGTLAAPGVVNSVPCGPGKFLREEGVVECILAQPLTLGGAAAGLADSVTCGPGEFRHRGDDVRCVLAQSFTLDGATLAANHAAVVRLGRGDGRSEIAFGTLAEPASIAGLACSPGEVVTGEPWRGCVLAHDQEVGDFWLMGGTPARVSSKADGRTELGMGTVFARPLVAYGVTLPPGTSVRSFPPARPDELREGSLSIGLNFSFDTAEDAVVPLLGGEIHGGLRVALNTTTVEVEKVGYRGTGVFILGGRRVEGARFDREKGAWQVYRE